VAAAAVAGAAAVAAAVAGHAAVSAPDPLEAVVVAPASNGLHPAAAAAAAAADEQQDSGYVLPAEQHDVQASSAAGQLDGQQQQQSASADYDTDNQQQQQPGPQSLDPPAVLQQLHEGHPQHQHQEQQQGQQQEQLEGQQQVPADMDVHQLSSDEPHQAWPAAQQDISPTQGELQQQQQQDMLAALQHQEELLQHQEEQQEQEQHVSGLHDVQPDTGAAADADVPLEGLPRVPSSGGKGADDALNHIEPLDAAADDDMPAADHESHEQQQQSPQVGSLPQALQHPEPHQLQQQEQHLEPQPQQLLQQQQQHPEPQQQQQQQQEVLSYLDQPPVFDEPDYLGAWGPGGGAGGGVDSSHLHLLNGLLGDTAAADAGADANSSTAAVTAPSSRPAAAVSELPVGAGAGAAGVSILGSSFDDTLSAVGSAAAGEGVKVGPSCPLDLLDAELAGWDEGEAGLEPAAAAEGSDAAAAAAAEGSAAAAAVTGVQAPQLASLSESEQQQMGLLESLDLLSDGAAGFDDVSLDDSNTHKTHRQQQQQVEHVPVQHIQQQQQRSERPTPELYASLLQPEEGVTTGDSPSDPSPFEHLAALPAAALPAGSAALAPHVTGTPAAAAAGAGNAGSDTAAAAAGGVVGGSSSSSWDPLGVSSSAPPAEAVVERLGSSAGGGASSHTQQQQQ
jgi:hypothetical protein